MRKRLKVKPLDLASRDGCKDLEKEKIEKFLKCLQGKERLTLIFNNDFLCFNGNGNSLPINSEY